MELSKRPERAISKTYREPTSLGTAFITITEESGEPIEVFIVIGKGGSDTHALAEGIGRLCSIILRARDLGSRTDRARAISRQLRDIGGPREVSLPDAIGKVLEEYIT